MRYALVFILFAFPAFAHHAPSHPDAPRYVLIGPQ
jgi:hypothetical protein